jgi:hypothetical protein
VRQLPRGAPLHLERVLENEKAHRLQTSGLYLLHNGNGVSRAQALPTNQNDDQAKYLSQKARVSASAARRVKLLNPTSQVALLKNRMRTCQFVRFFCCRVSQ